MSISSRRQAQTLELARLTSIHPSLLPGDQLSAELHADEQFLGQFSHRAKREGPRRVPALEFCLPPGAVQLTLRGRLERADGRASVFARRWRLLKLGSLTTALYSAGSLASGVVNFERRLRALEQQSAGQFRSPLRIAMVPPAAHAAYVRAAIARVGYVPGVLVDLCRLQIAIASGSFLAPLTAQTVTEGLRERGLFGSGETDALPWLSPTTRARFDRSLLVYLDVAQGLGLAWDPHDVRVGEATHSRLDHAEGGAVLGERGLGLWYWVRAATIDEPELVLNRDRTPCGSQAALLQLFARRVIAHQPHQHRRCYSLVDYLLESAAQHDRHLGGDLLVVDNARESDCLSLDFDDCGVRPQLRSLDYEPL